MQVVITVTLTPDDLKTGAVSQARAAASAAMANSGVLNNVPCTSDVQAAAPSTFTFDITPPAAAGSGASA